MPDEKKPLLGQNGQTETAGDNCVSCAARPVWVPISRGNMADGYGDEENASRKFLGFSMAGRHQRRRSVCLGCFHLFALIGILSLLLFTVYPKLPSLGIGHWSGTPAQFPEKHCEEGADSADCNGFHDFSKTYAFNDLNSFSVRNLIRPAHRREHFRNSFFHILPASKHQKDDIVVEFSFNTTDITLKELLHVSTTDNSLTIEFPDPKPTPDDDASREIIESQTRVYVQSGVELKNLEVESKIFGVKIPKPIDLWVDHAVFNLAVGDFNAEPMFDVRKNYIHIQAGSVNGQFPLYDVLSMESEAGTLSPEIIPQKADKDDPQPARFIAHSDAGSIHAEYRTDQGLPNRDYQVDLQSRAGRITGWYVHGTTTKIESKFGDIRVNLLPYDADDKSELTTISQAGRQKIVVLPPYKHTKTPLNRLESKHETNAGAVEVEYPQTWEGTVEATSTLGHVEVDGPGLSIIKEKKGFGGYYIEAEKGQGGGRTICRAERGMVKFTVADAEASM